MRRFMWLTATAVTVGAFAAFVAFAVSQDVTAPKKTAALPAKFMYS